MNKQMRLTQPVPTSYVSTLDGQPTYYPAGLVVQFMYEESHGGRRRFVCRLPCRCGCGNMNGAWFAFRADEIEAA